MTASALVSAALESGCTGGKHACQHRKISLANRSVGRGCVQAADLRRAAKRRVGLASASAVVAVGSDVPGRATLSVLCAASTVPFRVDDEEAVLVAEGLVLRQRGIIRRLVLHVKVQQQRSGNAMRVACWHMERVVAWGGAEIAVRDVNCALQELAVRRGWLCGVAACRGNRRLQRGASVNEESLAPEASAATFAWLLELVLYVEARPATTRRRRGRDDDRSWAHAVDQSLLQVREYWPLYVA